MSRDHRRMDRFIVIPFSSGCRSHSSVDVVDARLKKPQATGQGAAAKPKGESLVSRLLKGFKNLSQIFAVYEEEDDGEETEMVIGYPTDVKHVAHIGWDGSTSTTQSVRSWNRPAPEAPSAAAQAASAPPTFSVRQLEFAMAAQAAGRGAGARAS